LSSAVKNLNTYDKAGEGELSWLSPKRPKTFERSLYNGTILIAPLAARVKTRSSAALILTENPKLVFSKIVWDFFSYLTEIRLPKLADAGVSKDAVIGKNVVLSKGVVIGEGVILHKNVSIGPNTVLANCEIEENTVIGANCSIGFPGFGFVKDIDGSYLPFPHVGRVRIGKNVRIGSNTCIDRGSLGDTVIGDGVKIDNLVHVAHNVVVGRNSIIIANTMIGGSTVIGDNVWVAPSVSLMNKIQVEAGALVGMGAVVLENVIKNSVVAGNPARVIRKNK